MMPSSLESEITRRFTTTEQRVSLPGLEVSLVKPRNSDDLISEADYVKDERLPYWADLWASAEALASFVMEEGPALRAELTAGAAAPRALELGCGLGLVAIATEAVGFQTLATDYYEDALLFVEYNAERTLGRRIATRMVDWNAMPEDLGLFDLVIAADVLYEMRYAPVLAGAIAKTLAPGGRFVLSDQGRIALHAFLLETEALGLQSRIVQVIAPPPGVVKPNITIYELRWRT